MTSPVRALLSRRAVAAAVLLAAWPAKPLWASGAFGTLELGAHRIVPVDATLDVVMDGDRTTFSLGAAAGYEFPSRLFLGIAASRFGYDPAFRLFRGGHFAEWPSRIRIMPLLGIAGVRLPLGSRFNALLSFGAGAAYERQESDSEPRLWNRTNWRFASRVGVTTEYQLGSVGVGLDVGWLFLPAVRTPQLPAIDFGGFQLAGTMSFGRKAGRSP
jgi:hypothetical protein